MRVERIIISNCDIEVSTSKDIGKLRVKLMKYFNEISGEGTSCEVLINTKVTEFHDDDFLETTLKKYTDTNGVTKKTIRRNGKKYILKLDLIDLGIKNLSKNMVPGKK